MRCVFRVKGDGERGISRLIVSNCLVPSYLHDTYIRTSQSVTQPTSPQAHDYPSSEPLLRVKVGLDVRNALGGDRVDGVQWHDAILLVKNLHLIEIR